MLSNKRKLVDKDHQLPPSSAKKSKTSFHDRLTASAQKPHKLSIINSPHVQVSRGTHTPVVKAARRIFDSVSSPVSTPQRQPRPIGSIPPLDLNDHADGPGDGSQGEQPASEFDGSNISDTPDAKVEDGSSPQISGNDGGAQQQLHSDGIPHQPDHVSDDTNESDSTPSEGMDIDPPACDPDQNDNAHSKPPAIHSEPQPDGQSSSDDNQDQPPMLSDDNNDPESQGIVNIESLSPADIEHIFANRIDNRDSAEESSESDQDVTNHVAGSSRLAQAAARDQFLQTAGPRQTEPSPPQRPKATPSIQRPQSTPNAQPTTQVSAPRSSRFVRGKPRVVEPVLPDVDMSYHVSRYPRIFCALAVCALVVVTLQRLWGRFGGGLSCVVVADRTFCAPRDLHALSRAVRLQVAREMQVTDTTLRDVIPRSDETSFALPSHGEADSLLQSCVDLVDQLSAGTTINTMAARQLLSTCQTEALRPGAIFGEVTEGGRRALEAVSRILERAVGDQEQYQRALERKERNQAEAHRESSVTGVLVAELRASIGKLTRNVDKGLDVGGLQATSSALLDNIEQMHRHVAEWRLSTGESTLQEYGIGAAVKESATLVVSKMKDLQHEAADAQRAIDTWDASLRQRRTEGELIKQENSRPDAAQVAHRVQGRFNAVAADGGIRDLGIVTAGARLFHQEGFSSIAYNKPLDRAAAPATSPWHRVEQGVQDFAQRTWANYVAVLQTVVPNHAAQRASVKSRQHYHQTAKIRNRPESMFLPTRPVRDCWPMAGQRGNVTLELASTSLITGFAVEHGFSELRARHDNSVAPYHVRLHGIDNHPCTAAEEELTLSELASEAPEELPYRRHAYSSFGVHPLPNWVVVAVDKFYEYANWAAPTLEVGGSAEEQQPFGNTTRDRFCTSEQVLGELFFDRFGSRIQMANVNVTSQADAKFKVVKFEVVANHGNPEYTCVHRLRVLGEYVEAGP